MPRAMAARASGFSLVSASTPTAQSQFNCRIPADSPAFFPRPGLDMVVTWKGNGPRIFQRFKGRVIGLVIDDDDLKREMGLLGQIAHEFGQGRRFISNGEDHPNWRWFCLCI